MKLIKNDVEVIEDVVNALDTAIPLAQKNPTLQELTDRWNTVTKIADLIKGKFLSYAKAQSTKKVYVEFLTNADIKTVRAQQLIKYYEDYSELQEELQTQSVPLPTSATKHSVLKGNTPKEKSESWQVVKEATGKDDPSRADIKENLSLDTRVANLKENLNEDDKMTPCEVVFYYSKRFGQGEKPYKVKREFLKRFMRFHPDHGGEAEEWNAFAWMFGLK